VRESIEQTPYTATVRHLQEAGEVAAEETAEEGAESSGVRYVRLQAPQWIEQKPDWIALGLSAKDYGARLSSPWTALAV